MGLFGGSKKKEREEERIPTNVLSIRGQLAASNRFRGVCLILTLFALIGVSAVAYQLAIRPRIIVGIDSDGRPQLLHEVERNVSLDLFIREFISRFLCFSPNSVNENMKFAKTRISDSFAKAYNQVLGPNFINDILEFGVIQVTSVYDVNIANYSDTGFTAIAQCGRIKNDKINKQTVEQKLTVEITVVRGHITDENPWGYYVDQIRETVSN